MAEGPAHAATDAQDLNGPTANFFSPSGPTSRASRRKASDSFRYPDPKQIKLDQTNSRLFPPKLGWLRYRNSRDVLGAVKNITVSQSCGKWFVPVRPSARSNSSPQQQAQSASTWALPGSPRCRTALTGYAAQQLQHGMRPLRKRSRR